MPKERTREAHADAKRMTEKCSSVACLEKPTIEIVAWDGVTLSNPILLCRKHWLERCDEPIGALKMKVIHFMKDLRSYL